MNRADNRIRQIEGVLLFVAAAGAYGALRTQQYAAVDGALRCLDVLRRDELFLHPVNHMLYPVAVAGWHGLLALVGIGTTDPEAFVRLTQWMNAVAAAGCVVCTYAIVRRCVGSRSAALIAAVALGCSKAVLLHATSSAEPMVGLLLSLVSFWVLCLWVERRSSRTLLASGVLLGLAAASYESMALLGIAAVTFVMVVGRDDGVRRLAASARSAAVVGVTALSLFGAVYAVGVLTSSGAERALFRGLVAVPYADVWGGFSLEKVRAAGLGFVINVISPLPAELAGARNALRRLLPGTAFSWTGLLAVGAPVLLGIVLLAAVRHRRALTGVQRALGFASLVGFVATSAVPLYWFPSYDKLWLQPIAFAALGSGVLLGTGVLGRFRPVAGGLAVAGIVLTALANLLWAVPAHTHPSPFLADARAVADAVQPSDAIVRGWDPVSVMYAGILDRAGTSFDLPLRILERGASARRDLEDVVRRTRERRGRVYFLGVLDWDAPRWAQHVNRRTEFRFEDLSTYRDSAAVVQRFADGALPITLRRF